MTAKPPPEVANPRLAGFLRGLLDAKGQEAAWADEKTRMEGLALKAMEGIKSTTFTDADGDTHQATRVDPEGVETDFAALRKKLTAAQWALITTQVVDTKKLEAAILTGQISKEVVAAASQVKPRKSYILFTQKRGGRRRK